MLGFSQTWWSSDVAEWKLVYQNLKILYWESSLVEIINDAVLKCKLLVIL